MMHAHVGKLLKDMEVAMENKGDKLVITLSGEKEKVAVLEKKLNAMKELCSCDGECDCGEDCHCGDDCHCNC